MEHTLRLLSRLELLFQVEGWRKPLPPHGPDSRVHTVVLSSYPEESPAKSVPCEKLHRLRVQPLSL